MRGKEKARLSLNVRAVGLTSFAGVAAAHPAMYLTQVPTRGHVKQCVRAAKSAITAAGLDSIAESGDGVGGHTTTTRGYITCVRRPKDGACGGDGSTAVIVAAGDDAKDVLAKIKAKFVPPNPACM